MTSTPKSPSPELPKPDFDELMSELTDVAMKMNAVFEKECMKILHSKRWEGKLSHDTVSFMPLFVCSIINATRCLNNEATFQRSVKKFIPEMSAQYMLNKIHELSKQHIDSFYEFGDVKGFKA